MNVERLIKLNGGVLNSMHFLFPQLSQALHHHAGRQRGLPLSRSKQGRLRRLRTLREGVP